MSQKREIPVEVTYYRDPKAAADLRAYLIQMAEKGRALKEAQQQKPQAS